MASIFSAGQLVRIDTLAQRPQFSSLIADGLGIFGSHRATMHGVFTRVLRSCTEANASAGSAWSFVLNCQRCWHSMRVVPKQDFETASVLSDPACCRAVIVEFGVAITRPIKPAAAFVQNGQENVWTRKPHREMQRQPTILSDSHLLNSWKHLQTPEEAF